MKLGSLVMIFAVFTTVPSGITAQSFGRWDESASGTPLDIQGYRIVFDEPFDHISLDGPRIFAPVHAPYGAGMFDRPGARAYSIAEEALSISAYRVNGKWHSGSVQTADADQAAGKAPFTAKRGFACQGCYFETRMRLPAGKEPGFWGAFWLLSPEIAGSHVEIDVLEWYGGDPKGHHQSVHVWPADRRDHVGLSNYTGMTALMDGAWHTYGAQVIGGMVHIYMDRREVSHIQAPHVFDTEYYPVASLAVFPKEQAIAREGMHLDVDYVRAYKGVP